METNYSKEKIPLNNFLYLIYATSYLKIKNSKDSIFYN